MAVKDDLLDLAKQLLEKTVKLPVGAARTNLVSKISKVQLIIDEAINTDGTPVPTPQGQGGGVSPVPLGNGGLGCC